MKLLLAKPRGFCAGVVRAIDTVKKALELFGAPIYVKHEIVHNKHVVKELQDLGAIFIEDLDDVPIGARLIYSAHGIPPWVRDQAKQRNLIEIDATCGLVTKVHSAVKRYAQKGYKIILIGHRKHVETIGTAGEASEAVTIVESVDEVEKLTFPPNLPMIYLTQTTLGLDDVKEISEALLLRYPQIETLPSSSICYATTNRQMALKEIAQKVDLFLVVGDPQSSNSNRLREVATRIGIPAYLINGPDEIQQEWLKNVQTIGMSAGASTPESIVVACIQKLYEFGLTSLDEITTIEENVFFQLPKIG